MKTKKIFIYAFGSLLVISLLGNAAFVKKHFDTKPLVSTLRNPYGCNRESIYTLFSVGDSDIVFLGDSHTQKFLIAEYLPGIPIKNRGIDGDDTKGMRRRFIRELAPHYGKKLFIEAGLNDIMYKESVDSACININAMIDMVQKQSPHTKLYLNTVFPCSYKNMNDGERIRKSTIELNKKLVVLAKQQGVTLIDINPYLSMNGVLSPELDCGDHIHLNGIGYQIWTKELLKRL